MKLPYIEGGGGGGLFLTETEVLTVCIYESPVLPPPWPVVGITAKHNLKHSDQQPIVLVELQFWFKVITLTLNMPVVHHKMMSFVIYTPR